LGRSWIAFYMGDYQKDTNRLTTLEHGAYFLLLQECWTHGNIPAEPGDRAAIAKMTLREWLKIAPKINLFFGEDGTQKRATEEIEKAEIIRTKRALAGIRGGLASGLSRAIAGSKRSKPEANLNQISKQNTNQMSIQKGNPAEANHNNNIKPTTSLSVERGLGKVEASPVVSLSRAELEASFEKRKQSG